MKNVNPEWEQLFQQQAHARLGLLLQKQGLLENGRVVAALADDEVILSGAVESAARRTKRATPQEQSITSVAVMPESNEESWESFRLRLTELREKHPDAELAGVGPSNRDFCQRFVGLDRAVFVAGHLGTRFEEAPELELSRRSIEGVASVTAVVVYTPEVSAKSIEEAARQLSRIPKLHSVVALPAGAGDRIPLKGVTTSGTSDVMVCAALRYLLPSEIRVRASWAALGWKVAQVALAYGADECAGWSSAEALVYSPRVRAAARCEREELEAGLREARVVRGSWDRSRQEAGL